MKTLGSGDQAIQKTKDEATALKYMFSVAKDPKELANLVSEKYDRPITGPCGEIKFKDGRVIERYYQPQRLGNQIIGHVWSFREVTQRKLQEGALRLRQRAIDASIHGVVIAHKTGKGLRIVDTNPVLTHILSKK